MPLPSQRSSSDAVHNAVPDTRRPTGPVLKALREQLGLSRDELAELLNIPVTVLEHWEAEDDQHSPAVDALLAECKADLAVLQFFATHAHLAVPGPLEALYDAALPHRRPGGIGANGDHDIR